MALPLDNDVWYRLHRRLMPLAAEVPAVDAEHRAWIYVRPAGKERYVLHYIEILRDDYEQVWNTYDYDEYLVVSEHYEAYGDDELKSLLQRWLDDLRALKDPFIAGYPL